MKRIKKAIKALEHQCDKLAALPCLPPTMRLLLQEDNVAFCDDDAQWHRAGKALRVRCPDFLHGMCLAAALENGGREDIIKAMKILRTPVLNEVDIHRATEAVVFFFLRAVEHQSRLYQLLRPKGPDGSVH